MWKRNVGMKKSHHYPRDMQVSSKSLLARCGVIHLSAKLIDESDTGNRCTSCQRLYDREMGLFA